MTHSRPVTTTILQPARQLVSWNEFHWKIRDAQSRRRLFVRICRLAQDAASKEQFSLFATPILRDTRFWFKASAQFHQETDDIYMAIMYDGANTGQFLVRETGLMIAFPELSGYIFVGRTKEGFSLNKIMVGYAGWTMERSTINDAIIPILADGIKWLGYHRKNTCSGMLVSLETGSLKVSRFPPTTVRPSGRIAWVPCRRRRISFSISVSTSGMESPTTARYNFARARNRLGSLFHRYGKDPGDT